jgi:putative ABC transport system ATP-binding protein
VQFIRSCTAYIEQEPILDAENVQEALQLPEDILNRGNSRISGSEKTADCTVARGLLLGKKL